MKERQAAVCDEVIACDAIMDKVGPYILSRVLGQGTTGLVRLGTHQLTNEQVAIKIISKAVLSRDRNVKERVEREIEMLKLLSHPNILKLYDVCESDTALYIVLEYAENGDLYDYILQYNRLSTNQVHRLFQQIIDAVDYFHQCFVCHHDLKPENILLDSHGEIKIADFGLAALQYKGMLLDQSCGSPHYASPEIIRGMKYNGMLSDLWSCGIILYVMLTGSLPFEDENILKVLMKIKIGTFTIPSYVPSEVQTVLRKLLVVNPKKRLTRPSLSAQSLYNNDVVASITKLGSDETPDRRANHLAVQHDVM
eukprot:Ihof_evm3s284 gene=Ihof_evmTU3s284